jgi:DNA-binding beta-propeller fold protein YncE
MVMKKIYAVFSLILVCCLFFSLDASAMMKYPMNYIYADEVNEKLTNSNGHIYIPITYTVEQVYSYVEHEYNTTFNYPEDIFIDDQDVMYVADSGNNRVVKMSLEGDTLAIYEGASGSGFSSPRGVFVDDTGVIYVADSGNKRIVEMDQEGNLIKEYGKPDSDLLSTVEDFIPTKVAIGPSGYIYMLVGKDFMAIDKNNQFKGYIGAADLDFNLMYAILGAILTDEQLEKIDTRQPPSYTNFMIDDEGRFLACSNGKTDQIRIVNAVGNNIYAAGFFGEVLSIDNENNEYIRSKFADLTSDENGIISALDQESGYIYQYDCEGNILTVFGGKGENRGYFDIPVSIASDSEGNIYVLDATRKNIQRFESTGFMDQIHEASQTYFDGEYEKSLGIWEEILTLCSDYPLARRRIGAIYYKNELYEESKNQYMIAEDMEGYSEAFAKYRHGIFKENFLLVVFLIAVVVAVLLALVSLAKKHANKVRDRIYAKRRSES